MDFQISRTGFARRCPIGIKKTRQIVNNSGNCGCKTKPK